MQSKNALFSDVTAIMSMMNGIHGYVERRDGTEPINVQLVSGTYFTTLGVPALIGCPLTDDDRIEGNHPVSETPGAKVLDDRRLAIWERKKCCALTCRGSRVCI
jgi:hypothetical protein